MWKVDGEWGKGKKSMKSRIKHDPQPQAAYRIALSFLVFLFLSFFSFIDSRTGPLGKVGRMTESLSWHIKGLVLHNRHVSLYSWMSTPKGTVIMTHYLTVYKNEAFSMATASVEGLDLWTNLVRVTNEPFGSLVYLRYIKYSFL